MTTVEEWEERADRLHRRLLELAEPAPVTHAGRDGRLWVGVRETVLRELWPNVQGSSRTHPYGGSLSRKLAGAVVPVDRRDGETVWWIAADRHSMPAERDPRQCPTCKARFDSTQARRGHQASHRQGPRRLWADGDVQALADALAPRLAPLLAASSATHTSTGDRP